MIASKEDPFAEFSRGTDQIQFGRDGKLDDYPLILLDRYDFAFGYVTIFYQPIRKTFIE